MPVLNGEQYIAEAIASALGQGANVSEVIVINDGSTDRTADIVSSFSDRRVRLIDTPGSVRGVAAARNLGISAAVGEWLYFLDADDRLRKDALARLINVARENPEAVGVYGDYCRMRADGLPLRKRSLFSGRKKPSGDIRTALLSRNFIATGVILLRSDVMRRVGGFSAGLYYAEDWHAWCRLAALGSIIYAPGVQVFDYRMHEASATMQTKLDLNQFQPALEAIFGDALLMERLDPNTQSHLRRKAETFLRTYVGCQKLRSGRVSECLALAIDTIVRHPSQTPYVLSRTAAAALGL
jgi:glycosyltransferase involved in cell wall biosynthesis